jgi:hypothetical protein
VVGLGCAVVPAVAAQKPRRGLRGEEARIMVLSFRCNSFLSPLKRPQKKKSKPPRTTTQTQAITMPAMAPVLILAEELWAEGGLGLADGVEDGLSAGKGSPGDKA